MVERHREEQLVIRGVLEVWIQAAARDTPTVILFGLESYPRGQRALRAEIPTGVLSMRGQGSGGANAFPATALGLALSDVQYY